MTHPLTYRALPRSASDLWQEFVASWPLPEAFDKPHVRELKAAADREWEAAKAQRNSFDALAQRADDDWTERNWA